MLLHIYICIYHKFLITIKNTNELGKTNAFLNSLISHRAGIDKIYLWVKDSYEAKCQLLINKGESAGLKYYNHLKAFIDMDDIC